MVKISHVVIFIVGTLIWMLHVPLPAECDYPISIRINLSVIEAVKTVVSVGAAKAVCIALANSRLSIHESICIGSHILCIWRELPRTILIRWAISPGIVKRVDNDAYRDRRS